MPDDRTVPDIYTDFVNVIASEGSVVFGFRTTSMPWEALPIPAPGAPGEGVMSVPTELKAVVRMTPAHAKALTMQLKQILKAYESRFGEIVLPDVIATRINFQSRDWD